MKFKRILLIFMALLILSSCFVSCAKNNDEGDTSDTVETEGQEELLYDENGYLMDRLPDNLDFEGKKIDMLHWQTNGEYVTDAPTDTISSALYYRVLNTQERLNNFISIEYAGGGWYDKTDFITKVYSDVMSGAPHFELVSHYSFAAPIGAMYGIYQNLNNVKYIDLEMPWWYSDITEYSEIDGKIYFATGDIAPNTTKMTCCMFFNADLLTTYGYDVENFYAEAIAGDWTFAKMEMMLKNTYADKSGNGVVDENDFFGLSIVDNAIYDSLFYSAGMRIIDKNANGTYSLSRDWSGVKTDTLVKDCIDLFYSQDCLQFTGAYEAFAEGRSLLILTYFNYALGDLRDVNFKYGVLPIPKYDEDQSSYGTCLAPTHSLYSVTFGCSSPEMAGATLEALASDGYRNITPAIFEEGLKVKYAESPNDAALYDIIRDSVMFDIGRIWGDQINVGWRNAFGTFRNAIEYKNGWMTLVAETQGTYIECLEKITATITALEH